MKKICYISNSVERLTDLPEFEIIREELSTDLSVSSASTSDVILINHDDLIQASPQVSVSIMATLIKSARPVLLFTHDTKISAVDSQQIFNSGMNGLICDKTLTACHDLLLNLKPVKQSVERGVTRLLIEPYAQAISEVLQTTFGTRSQLTAILTGRIHPPEGEFSSSMIIRGGIEGQAVAVLPQEQIRLLIARLLGCDKNKLTKRELSDGVNEIINQVSGRVRTMEWPEKHKFNIELPKLVEGNAWADTQTTEADWITLLIECYGQILSLSIRAEMVAKQVSLQSPA